MVKRVFSALAVLCAASTAWAAPVIYHFSGVASGTLGSNVLNQVRIDIRAPGDTTAIYSLGLGIWAIDQAAGSAQVSVTGFGTGVFTDHTMVFDNQSAFGGTVGFTAVSVSLGFNDIIQIHDEDIGSTFFSSYDLTSTTGVYGHVANPSVWDWDVATSLGVLTVNSMLDTTFEATVIPEPMSGALVSLCFIAFAARKWQAEKKGADLGFQRRG